MSLTTKVLLGAVVALIVYHYVMRAQVKGVKRK